MEIWSVLNAHADEVVNYPPSMLPTSPTDFMMGNIAAATLGTLGGVKPSATPLHCQLSPFAGGEAFTVAGALIANAPL